jgi:hypothetical protein
MAESSLALASCQLGLGKFVIGLGLGRHLDYVASGPTGTENAISRKDRAVQIDA